METIAFILLSAATASASPYALHEWGTFTTVAGSDGVLLAGLEREEAPLPQFAYSHSISAAKTEAILPLEASPAPEKIVRVIVGRSEVLRPAREKEWLALSTSAVDSERSRWDSLKYGGRFGLAYQRRIQALSVATARK